MWFYYIIEKLANTISNRLIEYYEKVVPQFIHVTAYFMSYIIDKMTNACFKCSLNILLLYII